MTARKDDIHYILFLFGHNISKRGRREGSRLFLEFFTTLKSKFICDLTKSKDEHNSPLGFSKSKYCTQGARS